VEGRLHLSFHRSRDTGQTVMEVLDQRPPLRVVRAFPTGDSGALVHLHNVSGGVLAGDRLELQVDVQPDARVQLTTTGASRVYRAQAATPAAIQMNTIRVEEGGVLEYLPDPVIPFAGSRYRQETRIELTPGAGLFWWETLAPGREAFGERFDYNLLEIRLDLIADGQPIALERIRLEPHQRPLSSLARLGPCLYSTTFYICKVGVPSADWLALETRLNELAHTLSQPGWTLWGASALRAHGLVIRGLSVRSRDVPAGLLAFWRPAKQELYGEEIEPPRKIY
jgi:urease accessory protein